MALGVDALTWVGIAICVSQSAMFSGMNLAMFSLSRLQLEIEQTDGNARATKVLAMRADSNFLLTTILWGNVGVNVLLTLLSDSVLAGAAAFLFSTVVITLCGEIAPQAYFSRNALKVAGVLAPVLRVYQILLYPVAKPCALVLDAWLGREGIEYLRERNLRELIRKHTEAPEAKDIDRLEGLGALNFLSMDDLPVSAEGEAPDPASIVTLPFDAHGPVFPPFTATIDDPFLRQIEASGKKWVILVDENGEPCLVLDAHEFLRDVLFGRADDGPLAYCHRPIIVRSARTPLGWALSRLRFDPTRRADQIIDEDVILLWGDTKRVITGTDILGRLMEGIADRSGSTA